MKTKDESRSVGRISKQWGGLLREALTDADDFGLQFPIDLDVRAKAVLLGATFLIVSGLSLPFCLLLLPSYLKLCLLPGPLLEGQSGGWWVSGPELSHTSGTQPDLPFDRDLPLGLHVLREARRRWTLCHHQLEGPSV